MPKDHDKKPGTSKKPDVDAKPKGWVSRIKSKLRGKSFGEGEQALKASGPTIGGHRARPGKSVGKAVGKAVGTWMAAKPDASERPAGPVIGAHRGGPAAESTPPGVVIGAHRVQAGKAAGKAVGKALGKDETTSKAVGKAVGKSLGGDETTTTDVGKAVGKALGNEGATADAPASTTAEASGAAAKAHGLPDPRDFTDEYEWASDVIPENDPEYERGRRDVDQKSQQHGLTHIGMFLDGMRALRIDLARERWFAETGEKPWKR